VLLLSQSSRRNACACCVTNHIRSNGELWDQNNRPVNNNIEVVFSAQSIPMAAHAIKEYVTPLLNNNFTVTEEQCFLCSPRRCYIMSWVLKSSLITAGVYLL
jgi:hypothetical protein